MKTIVDLHIHSRYSRACSKDLTLPLIAQACERKGIDVVGTGDFTHPAWCASIKELLQEETPGMFVLRDGSSKTKFVLTTELACIYTHRDAVRRLHLCVFAPSIAAVETLNAALVARGCNIRSDGRPILGLSAKELLKIMLDIDPAFMMVPAHAWTPWFAVFGSKSGYDTLEECLEELTPHIRAIETGLSSDPLMNRRLSTLDNITLISNSDAHSLEKLGREANVFDLPTVTYAAITEAIATGDRARFLYTIEFFPEEGKYHFDGHRDCGVSLHPRDSTREGFRCPICKKPLTIGVMNRVEELADRAEDAVPMERFIGCKKIVPLDAIIADTLGVGTASKRVRALYDQCIAGVGSEFFVLLDAPAEAIARASSSALAEAIARVRAGTITVEPGYDGVYGRVKIFNDEERKRAAQQPLF
ncbi:MAG: DNA helicase UvrD [Candidatus Magasanikbacteria bacterium]|nr:DNA helicase UvrD [Candidatus Magasanikbacteria bacterium]